MSSDNPAALNESDPNWVPRAAACLREVAAALADLPGAEEAAFDHIGSTSVLAWLQSPSSISRSASCLCRAMGTSCRALRRSGTSKPSVRDRIHPASGTTFRIEMRTLRPTFGRSASTLPTLREGNPSSSTFAARTPLGATTPFGFETGCASIRRLVSGTRTPSGDCLRRTRGGPTTTTTPARRPSSSRRCSSASGPRPRRVRAKASEPAAQSSARVRARRHERSLPRWIPVRGRASRALQPGCPDVAILADYVRPGGIVSLMLPNPVGMVLRQYRLIAAKP